MRNRASRAPPRLLTLALRRRRLDGDCEVCTGTVSIEMMCCLGSEWCVCVWDGAWRRCARHGALVRGGRCLISDAITTHESDARVW